MYNHTLDKIVENSNSYNKELVKLLFNEAPILKSIPVQLANTGMYHLYNVFANDGSYDTAKIEQYELSAMCFKIEAGEDKIMQQCEGSFDKYFDNKVPATLTKCGIELEKSIVSKMIQHSIKNNRYASINDTDSYAFPIVCVNYSDVLNTCLLYHKMWLSDLIKITQLGAYINEDLITVYGATGKLYLSIFLNNNENISSLLNTMFFKEDIGYVNSLAEIHLDNLISNANIITKKDKQMSVIYCHPKTITQMKELGLTESCQNKDTSLIDRTLSCLLYKDIPIVSSYHFDDNFCYGAKVSDARKNNI